MRPGLRPGVGGGSAKDAGVLRLSRAEREIVDLLSLGISNKSIAKLLGKSPATIKSQLEIIYFKTGAANRARLAAMFDQLRQRG